MTGQQRQDADAALDELLARAHADLGDAVRARLDEDDSSDNKEA